MIVDIVVECMTANFVRYLMMNVLIENLMFSVEIVIQMDHVYCWMFQVLTDVKKDVVLRQMLTHLLVML